MSLGSIANSLDEMRESIRDLLANDFDREQIGRRAREFATREYTTGVAARYLELLDVNSTRLPRGTAPAISRDIQREQNS
jgi:hypothetical protein